MINSPHFLAGFRTRCRGAAKLKVAFPRPDLQLAWLALVPIVHQSDFKVPPRADAVAGFSKTNLCQDKLCARSQRQFGQFPDPNQ